MSTSKFSDGDLQQIRENEQTVAKIEQEIESFKQGFEFAELAKPCTPGDGITIVPESDQSELVDLSSQAISAGRALKFVPASGAATRMFKQLHTLHDNYETISDPDNAADGALKVDIDALAMLSDNLDSFGFFQSLSDTLARAGEDLNALVREGNYLPVLGGILSTTGLNYSNLPKGLIEFHAYPDHSRTAFEEHLVEAKGYACDGAGVARVHYTISADYEHAITNHLEAVRSRHELAETKFEISFSFQKRSTNTVAVDLENRPFRDADGRLLFRPGGHGALIENLNDLQGDIIFIKNIDNIVPDRLKPDTFLHKKILSGILVRLQSEIFDYLAELESGDIDDARVGQIFDAVCDRLPIICPAEIADGCREGRIAYLLSKLNRPIRVCGMVRNEGEPGGGPFWVRHVDGSTTIQIVESCQVDMNVEAQAEIFSSATHFNPVDLVCGVRDYQGNSFDLRKYVDPMTGFISRKSLGGKELQAMELPGLWNGAMADWITLFVEVPISTFNPVKSVFDLLQKEHQPG